MCRHKEYSFAAIIFLVTILMLTGWGEQIQAQQKYPTKPIDIIIPLGPGATDMQIRVLAEYLKKKWGVPVNVINKPGGLSVPGCLEVYNAKPDGYTVLGDGAASTSLLLVSVQELPFKIMDRTFLGNITAIPYVYIVPFYSPIKSVKDLEAEIKRDPGNFTWSSIGGAGIPDYGTRKFMRAIGVDPKKTRPVICKGGVEILNNTVSSAVKFSILTHSTTAASIDAKLLRVLAVTHDKRLPKLPDVPTLAEAGYPSASLQDHVGPSGPPNMPSYIVEMWEKAMEEMMKDPESLTKIERLNVLPLYLNSRETRELRMKDIEEAKVLYGVK